MQKDKKTTVTKRKREKTNVSVTNKKPRIEGTGEKPDWKNIKESYKSTRLARKKCDNSLFDVIARSKKLWEEFRREDCPQEKRSEMVQEVHKMFVGHYASLVRCHDAARVVQWVVKNGKGGINDAIVQELGLELSELARGKFSCFCVRALLEFAGKKSTLATIVAELATEPVKLLHSRFSSGVVNDVYSKYASSEQKNLMRQDFFGDIFKSIKSKQVSCIEEAVQVCGETFRHSLLDSVLKKINLSLEKGHAGSEMVHSVLRDFLLHCPEEDEQRVALMTQVRSQIHLFVGSKDGAWLARLCVWNSTAKERKEIMKLCRQHLNELVRHFHGCTLVMALCDCVDDTVLLGKIILDFISEHALEIACNENGKKTLCYLTAHRDPTFVHPSLIESLKEGDLNKTSKKPMETRRAEILSHVLGPLLLSWAEHARDWLIHTPSLIASQALMKAVIGSGKDSVVAHEALVSVIVSQQADFEDKGGKKVCAIEHCGVHKFVKALISQDKARSALKCDLFCERILSRLDETQWWLGVNRGAFVLIYMLETEIPSVVKEIRKFLKANEDRLGENNSPAVDILRKKMLFGQA